MKTIWKYELPDPMPMNNASQWLTVAGTFRPLSVGMAQGKLAIWGEVETVSAGLTKQLSVFVQGTGSDLRHIERERFVGTVVQGNLVWHVFAGDAKSAK